jgi:hypothetical protein
MENEVCCVCRKKIKVGQLMTLRVRFEEGEIDVFHLKCEKKYNSKIPEGERKWAKMPK